MEGNLIMDYKIIALNGAPETGKDTVFSILNIHEEDNVFIVHMMFKDMLLRSINLPVLLTQSLEDSWKYHNVVDYEKYRDLDKSLSRKLLIDFSEKVIKPHLGQDFFARKTTKHIQDYLSDIPNKKDRKFYYFVITDMGFECEYQALKKEFGDKLTSVAINREGKNFDNDSREYVSHHDVIINNNGSLEELEKECLKLLSLGKKRYKVGDKVRLTDKFIKEHRIASDEIYTIEEINVLDTTDPLDLHYDYYLQEDGNMGDWLVNDSDLK